MKIGNFVKRIGKLRDGFLVSGAALYGLGYLVWTYTAWRNDLGQLPALEFQYVIAGVVPAILLTFVWGSIVFFQKIKTR
jgi:hypothetical protein